VGHSVFVRAKLRFETFTTNKWPEKDGNVEKRREELVVL
jgi:hypothetical protein